MLISVVMITYNHEPFIREAIEGVLMQQTTFPYELVIGEDCSTDRTREICMEYRQKHPDKIRLLLNEKNMGMMPNFIQTLNACSGKYIALCEGDDYWTDPMKLQRQVDFLETHPDFSLCFHNTKALKEGELVDDFITREVADVTGYDDLLEGNFIHTPTVVFRNIFIAEPFIIGKTPGLGDYYLYFLISKHGKFKKFNDIMAVYRYGQGVWSGEKNTLKKTKIEADTFRALAYNFNPDIILVEKWYSYLIKSGSQRISVINTKSDYLSPFENKLFNFYVDSQDLAENVSAKIVFEVIKKKIIRRLKNILQLL